MRRRRGKAVSFAGRWSGWAGLREVFCRSFFRGDDFDFKFPFIFGASGIHKFYAGFHGVDDLGDGEWVAIGNFGAGGIDGNDEVAGVLFVTAFNFYEVERGEVYIMGCFPAAICCWDEGLADCGKSPFRIGVMKDDGNIGDSNFRVFITAVEVKGLFDGTEGEYGGVEGEEKQDGKGNDLFHIPKMRYGRRLSAWKWERFSAKGLQSPLA